MGGLILLGGLLLILAIIGIIVGLVLYVIQAFGLYEMAKRAGLENSWLAFVPIANYFIMGKLIKEIKISQYVIPTAEIVLPVALVVLFALGRVSVIGNLVWLCVFLLYLAAYYNLYSLYRPKDAVMFTVFSIFVVTVPFFIFIMRKDPMVTAEQNEPASV
jgi:hypothetical protein